MRTGHVFDVRESGARGDGAALDSPAINAAILAAEAAGGGVVLLPPGRYLSFSIRLKSRVTLTIENGATLVAAAKGVHGGAYDPPEERGPRLYRDFGHSHWHNSLIWAEGAEDIAIVGKGRIDGLGLTRDGPGTIWKSQAGERPLSMAGMSDQEIAGLEQSTAAMQGMGNKAIGLVGCRRVRLEGLTIFKGGHFAVCASEVEDLDIVDLSIDTDRDGIDLDCVRRARVERCRVNSPNDDAIVLKASLGARRMSCEDVQVRGCTVTGFDLGTMLDGTRQRTQRLAPDRDRVTGRIKLGTESNGDFRRIRIQDCRFERSRGLAIETVDGGTIEDILAENIEMEEVTTAPLFLRLGARLRGPKGTTIGSMRNIEVRGLTARGIDPRFAAILAGLPGHPIEGVRLRDIDLAFDGGFAGPVPASPAELADAYPEPSMFGPTPAWGFWVRHVSGLEVERLRLSRSAPDQRPPVMLEDAQVTRAENANYWPAEV